MALLVALFRFTRVGLPMRASAFGQEVARLLGVRVGRMLTLGWALAAVVGSLSGLLIAGGEFVYPAYMDSLVVFGFVAAVLGGLDSPVGAVVGGLLLGPGAELRQRLHRQRAGQRRRAGDPDDRAAGATRRTVRQQRRAEGMTMTDPQTPTAGAGAATEEAPVTATAAANAPSAQAAGGGRSFLPKSTLLRHLVILLLCAVGAVILLEITSPFRNSQLADAGLLRHRGRRPHGADRPQRADLAGPRRADGGRRLHDRAVPAGPRGPLPLPLILLVAVRDRHRRRRPGRRGRRPAARPVPRRRDAGARRRRCPASRCTSTTTLGGEQGLRRAGARRPPEVLRRLHRLRLRQLPDRHQVARLRRRRSAC